MKRKYGWVVLGLLGLLSSMSLVSCKPGRRFEEAKKEADRAATWANIKTLHDGVYLFYAETGRYPTNTEGLQALIQHPTDKTLGPYARQDDLKDAWQQPIQYQYPGTNGRPFDLLSPGPDGKAGTKDDMTNADFEKPKID